MYARQIDKNGMCKNHIFLKNEAYVQKWHEVDMNMQFPRQLEEIFVCLRIKLRSSLTSSLCGFKMICQIKEYENA